MNELQVAVSLDPGKITCNFEEAKEALSLQMTAYTSMEITEAGQKDAKKDLATLRKIRTAFDDRRKAVKKEFMEPYDEFEKKAKELISVIDEPIALIDGKLKEFEKKRKEEKQTLLRRIYEENIGEYRAYLPFSDVKTAKWDNATYSENDVLYDIGIAITNVKSDIDAIKSLNSEIEDKCLEAYRLSGNTLAAAIRKNTDYLEAKKQAEENLRRQEEERRRQEEERKKQEEERIRQEAAQASMPEPAEELPEPAGELPEPVEELPEPVEELPEPVEEMPEPVPEPGFNGFVFRVWDADDFQMVKGFMVERCIEWEVL